MTVDVSSQGCLVSAVLSLIPVVGSRIEVSMEWPAQLDGKTSIQLVVRGKVVRAEPGSFALFFESHEFRTLKSPPLANRHVIRRTSTRPSPDYR